MRGCDKGNVNIMCAVAGESFEFLLLQDAQQFCLKFQWNVANFVKKKRALVRKFKASRFLSDRSGECAFFMTEQFTFQKPERDCSAIQFDKGPFPAAAQIANGTPDKSFTGSRLAQDQHALYSRR